MIDTILDSYIFIVIAALVMTLVGVFSFWKYNNLSWNETDTKYLLFWLAVCFIPVAHIAVFASHFIIFCGIIWHYLYNKIINITGRPHVIISLTKFINRRVFRREPKA